MSIESDAQNDLALNDADAASVVGGAKKKAARKTKVAHKPVGHSLPPIIVHTPTTPTEYVATDDCDPGETQV